MGKARCCGALIVLLGIVGAERAFAQSAPAKDYTEQILKATALRYRGLANDQEIARADEAMNELKKEKDAVASFILAFLLKGETREMSPSDVFDPVRMDTTACMIVLREFGGKYLTMLEPAVLANPNPPIRRNGLRVIGNAIDPDKPACIDLVLKVLDRDKDVTVIAGAIGALNELRAVKQYPAIRKFLKSESPEVRRAVVSLVWSYHPAEGRGDLEELLKTEKDRRVCFSAACALCGYDNYDDHDVWALLKHEHPGVRLGAIHSIGPKWGLALALVGEEKDPTCRTALGLLLLNRGQKDGIPLLIEALSRPDPQEDGIPYFTRASATSALFGLTELGEAGQSFRDALHKGLQDRAAQIAQEWWLANKNRLFWDHERKRFFTDQPTSAAGK